MNNEYLDFAKRIYKIYQYFENDDLMPEYRRTPYYINDETKYRVLHNERTPVFNIERSFSTEDRSIYQQYRNYIAYYPQCDEIEIQNKVQGEYADYYKIPFVNELDDAICFQLSLIHSKLEMQNIVLFWYLRQMQCKSFYFDMDFMDAIEEDIKCRNL